jgi:hypothetical protein
MATEDGITIVLTALLHGGMKVTVPSKLLRNQFRLIHAGGALSPKIDFL